LRRLARARSFKQGISQPSRIAVPEIERLTENPGLVSAARVRPTQAIAFDFSDVEDRLLTVRQT
jgi:hypothetical protein